MPIDNSTRFPKPLAADLRELSEGMAIVIDGNTAPKAIASGQYLFIKNHSTLATGGYHATAAIASGADITSSNVEPDADGIVNGAFSSLSEQIGTVNNKVSSLLYVTTHDCVPGTTSTGNFSKNIAISGYTPIGIVGMEAIASFEPITKLGEWFINGNTLYYRTTAPSTTSGIRFLVLYKKN